jgi:putative methionine-R-sulfoxide reductase with GAF domain
LESGNPQVEAKAVSRDYINAFANAVALFGSPKAGAEAFSRIPALLVADFDAIRSELWLWDESSGSAYLTNAAGLEGSHRRDYSIPDSVIGKVAVQGAPIYNALLARESHDDRDFGERSGLTHVSAFPLMAKHGFVGVCANYTREPVHKDLMHWWELCSQIGATTLHQVLADEDGQNTISQLSLLFEATRLLNSTLDLAELLELILRIARSEVQADRGTVFLVDSKNKQVWSVVAQGLDHQEIRVPFGFGVAGRVAVTGEIINVEDAYSLDYFERSVDQKTGYTTKSLLCAPIRHPAGYIVGVIQLLNHKVTGKFSEQDEEYLSKLSGHIAMALENVTTHRHLLEKK